jgi:hypothetical protein
MHFYAVFISESIHVEIASTYTANKSVIDKREKFTPGF